MTKILLLEDDSEKSKRIKDVIKETLDEEVSIILVSNFLSFTAEINKTRFDLVVLDLIVPTRDGREAIDVTDSVIETIKAVSLNAKAAYVAITKFDDLAEKRGRELAGLGIATVQYSDDSNWIPALQVTVQRAYRYQEHDFVIICALPLERSALQQTKLTVGDLFNRNGLNCQHISISDYNGVAVLLPRMGLVEASISTTKAIETFRPRLVTMVGICAAFKDRAELGSVIFGNPVWEHQSGKWFGEEFAPEIYQESLDDQIVTIVNQEIEKTNHFWDLKEDLGISIGPEFVGKEAVLSAMVSGSSVIASNDLQEKIASQHKRLVGLDMEMYGVYRAARQSTELVSYFGAKVAVDFADELKEDRYQRCGAVISARVVAHMIPIILSEQQR